MRVSQVTLQFPSSYKRPTEKKNIIKNIKIRKKMGLFGFFIKREKINK